MSDSHSNPKVKFHFILFIQSSKHSSQKLPQIGKEVPLLLGNHRGGPLDLEKYFEGVRVSIRVHEDFGCLGYPILNQLLVILLEGVFAPLWARKSAYPYGPGYQHPYHRAQNPLNPGINLLDQHSAQAFADITSDFRLANCKFRSANCKSENTSNFEKSYW